ncbi:MAG: bacteriohemerythrin [Spirochaetia bacterium]|nr:bacteriohemerythrin [Spirochaetia bacterium]
MVAVMSLFEWKENFSVKISRFDEAHKKLIELMNEIYAIIKMRKDNATIVSVVEELSEYSKTHFNDEVEQMIKFQYPYLKEHKEEHNQFIKELDNMKEMIQRQSNLLNVQLLNFIKDWLINHIMKSDMKYGQFFLDRGLK